MIEDKDIKSHFILGEEWLYYKFYCGKRTADNILIQVLYPILETLFEKELIDKWFFIRYADPKPHLRIRFHLINVSEIRTVISEVNKNISLYLESGLIWSVQIDTYQRELKRYNANCITEAETLFFHDSQACLAVLQLIEDDKLLYLYTLKSIDRFLSLFDYSINQKLELAQKNKMLFKQEFNADKRLNKQLKIKYLNLKHQIAYFMSDFENEEYKSLINILDNRDCMIREVVKKLKEKKVIKMTLLSNYIHMMINRTFRDQQRLYELICYDHLAEYYKNTIEKNK